MKRPSETSRATAAPPAAGLWGAVLGAAWFSASATVFSGALSVCLHPGESQNKPFSSQL